MANNPGDFTRSGFMGETMTEKEYYATSPRHILAELERIDLLIQVQVMRMEGASRERREGREPDRPAGALPWAAESGIRRIPNIKTALAALADKIEKRKAESLRRRVPLRLDNLARLFHLSAEDVEILLIALAPELDLRYERFFVHLQEDVSRGRPSVDLALNLLGACFENKLALRARLAPSAPLIRDRLILLTGDPSMADPPLLRRSIKVDDRIIDYLLEIDEAGKNISPHVRRLPPGGRLEEMALPNRFKENLESLAAAHAGKACIFYFQGRYGAGKQTAANDMCRKSGKGLLSADGRRLAECDAEEFAGVLRLTLREALLHGAALYWEGFDALFSEAGQRLLDILLRELEKFRGWVFLSGNIVWEPKDALHHVPFMRVEFQRPRPARRKKIWERALGRETMEKGGVRLADIADKFSFTGGQIRDAAATARNLAGRRDPENREIAAADLYEACLLQCNRSLENLAQRIRPVYTWSDIVLSEDRKQLLRAVCDHVKYRRVVHGAWGFDRKFSPGRGVSVLFTGPSGTGKTMAAEVITGEFGLELYKIDLAGVVSKYIGETEKNLSRIFEMAENANAVLFFDEADALFGKRTEVRDAHDRHANIEVGWLLQKMETYEGVVILATNLKDNMDSAFTRRLRFIIEFPLPDEAGRRRIWEKMWPENAPAGSDLDMGLMARRFEITGGNIRNIALDAAFLAASNGGAVTMNHLLEATRREYRKTGKVISAGMMAAAGVETG
ncbi:MAG: AAA family ATPase [Desulfobacterales bacterium]|nr:AAA family ATPase [Desulfobacterales bacterium]